MAEREIVVRLPEEWIASLEVLIDLPLPDVASVLADLADHAQQGIRRPGGWERDWLIKAFGTAFLSRLEPDPEHPYGAGFLGFQRPSRG